MPQLLSFRKGWQSEHLAKYLLSKFSFIAEPITVNDDSGVDFFCTQFFVKHIGTKDFCIPKSSFAIQIKSNLDFKIERNIDYIQNLGIPYYIGHVKKETSEMVFYSGEYLPELFAKIKKLDLSKWRFKIIFGEKLNDYEILPHFDINEKDSIIEIQFPKCFELDLEFDPIKDYQKVEMFSNKCLEIQKNISSLNLNEYTFINKNTTILGIHAPLEETWINFKKRLSECISTIVSLKRKAIPISSEKSEFFDYLCKYLEKNDAFKDPLVLIALAEWNMSKTPSYKQTKRKIVDI